MKLVIGVMGSAKRVPAHAETLAFEVGRHIALAGCILVTGATTGLPLCAARGATSEGGLVVGMSPAPDRRSHRALHLPEAAHDLIVFTGFGFKGRNVLNVRACDAIITVGGSFGTLNEFTIACDEGRVVGVLAGSGGISDHAERILELCDRTEQPLVVHASPAELVKAVVEALARA